MLARHWWTVEPHGHRANPIRLLPATRDDCCQYEIYFAAPTTVTGGFTITLTAQLGTGATAGNWKVEMLNFVSGWVEAGGLTGGTSMPFLIART